MALNALEQWHEIIKTADASKLDALLADDCVFHSPVVHTPQEGKEKSKMYLTAALLGLNGDFEYIKEVVSGNNAILEFQTKIGDTLINGVDMITWNEEEKITDFKVMIRPLKAISLIHQKMGALLKKPKINPPNKV